MKRRKNKNPYRNWRRAKLCRIYLQLIFEDVQQVQRPDIFILQLRLTWFDIIPKRNFVIALITCFTAMKSAKFIKSSIQSKEKVLKDVLTIQGITYDPDACQIQLKLYFTGQFWATQQKKTYAMQTEKKCWFGRRIALFSI